MDILELARKYREKQGYVGRGGVVIVFDGVAGAWVDRLRNPEHWRIGAYAVFEDGAVWHASGTQITEDDSASEWCLVRLANR